MNSIKTESDDTVCRGCLSADRRLLPLANYDFYFSLLDEKQKLEASKKLYLMLCWECVAVLRRLQLFRAQARRAHSILEDSLSTPMKNTLSHLTIKIKDKYDACFDDSRTDKSDFRLHSNDVVKHETSNIEIREANNDTDIKEEKHLTDIISIYENSNVPPKKRKTKTKTVKTKKRKVSFTLGTKELNVETKKISSTNETRKTREKKRVEIEICNVVENDSVNDDIDDKVHVKVECMSDNADDNWMQDSFDDTQTIKSKLDSGSDYSYREEREEKTKDDKKRVFTFKKTIVKYSADVLSYFAEIEMSEEEMRNVLEKQPLLVNKAKPYQCEFCGVSFKQRKTLDGHVNHSHRKAKHKDHIKKEPDTEESENKYFLYRCSLCDRMLRKEHTQSHLNEYHRHKFHCLACTWSKAFFWNKEDHSYHWQTVHAQLVCDICKQTRRNTHDMERHMRASHLPIKCPQCPRVYSKWKYYRQHQKLAHPVLALEPPESRYCVECDMQFPSIMAYKMHVMNQHRSTPKKRWPCPACDKTLNNKDTMKKHYALFHSDKTSYQCQHCGKYLSSKCSLQHHLNSHLNIKLPKDKLCSVCGRGFSTKRMLRFHSYTHTGERPYACPHCPAAFTQPNPLRVHARKQHPLLPVAVRANPAANQ